MYQKIYSNKIAGCGADAFCQFCKISQNTFATEHLCEYLFEQLVFNWLLKLAIYFYVNEVRYPDTKI